MTSNTLLPAAAYPTAFHRAIEEGGAVLYAGDLPWTPMTAAKRFRQLLVIYRKAGHPNAKGPRWRVQPTPSALVLSIVQPKVNSTTLAAILIDRATGGNSGRN